MTRKKKKQPSLKVIFKGLDTEITVTKVTGVKMHCSDNSFFHLDVMPDGKWRWIYDENMIPDISKLEGIEIVRVED